MWLVFLLIAGILRASYAQGATWARTYGGGGNDGATAVSLLPDGNLMVAGYTESSGLTRPWAMKLDLKGDVIWTRAYTYYKGDNLVTSVSALPDGRAVIVGMQQRGYWGWIMLLDEDGDTLWTKTFGVPKDVAVLPDGSFVVAGSSKGDLWVCKLDSEGNVIWDKTYGGDEEDTAESIAPLQEGGFIVVGATKSFGVRKQNGWVLRLDSEGNLVWSSTYSGKYRVEFKDVYILPDNSLLLTGGSSLDYGALKLDFEGNVIWTWNPYYIESVALLPDGNLVAVGYGYSNVFIRGYMRLSDIYICKLDIQSGHVLWRKTYGAIWENDKARAVCMLPDGSIIVVGTTESFGAGKEDAFVMKLDSEGMLRDIEITYPEEGARLRLGDFCPISWFWPFMPEGECRFSVTYSRGWDFSRIVDVPYNIWGHPWAVPCQGDVTLKVEAELDGEVVASGTRRFISYGVARPRVMRADIYGTEEWDDGARGACQLPGGRLAVVGSMTVDYDSDSWVQVYDGNWDVLWRRTYGEGNYEEHAYGVCPAPEDGLFVVGSKSGPGEDDVWVLRLGKWGDVMWDAMFGGIRDDRASAVCPTRDGGAVVAGRTMSFAAGCYDVYVLRLGPDGKLVWDLSFGGREHDWAEDVARVPEGGFVVAGMTFSYGRGWSDAWLIRLDEDGTPLWMRTYGGEGMDWASSILPLPGGDFLVAGGTRNPGEGSDALLLRVDGDGNLIWSRTYGGDGSEEARSLSVSHDGNLLVAGMKDYDFWLMEVDEDGEVLWERTYGGKDVDEAYGVVAFPDGRMALAGGTKSFGPWDEDILVLLLDERETFVWAEEEEGESSCGFMSPYPNPFNVSLVIPFSLARYGKVRVEVYNSMGRLVWRASGTYGPGVHMVAWDGRDMNGRPASSGVYVVRTRTGEGGYVRKVSLVR